MNENTTKADRWIDFLVPWNTAYYFKTRRMQTSIKVVIFMPLILGLLYRALCIAEKFIDNESTLGELFFWVSFWFAVLFIIYLGLAHTILTVAHDSIVEMILEWSKNRAKNNESLQASVTLPSSQEEIKAENKKEELEGDTVSVGEVPAEEVVEEVVSVEVEEVVETSTATVSYALNLPDPSKLENYIKAKAEIYSDGDGAAILYDVLLKKEIINKNLTKFHGWLESLIPVIGYTGLSEARKRVMLKKSEGEDDIVEKYDELFNEIINYII